MLKRPQPTGITFMSRARILQNVAPARKTLKAGMSFGSRSTQQQVVHLVILPTIRTAPWFDIRTPTIFGSHGGITRAEEARRQKEVSWHRAARRSSSS